MHRIRGACPAAERPQWAGWQNHTLWKAGLPRLGQQGALETVGAGDMSRLVPEHRCDGSATDMARNNQQETEGDCRWKDILAHKGYVL